MSFARTAEVASSVVATMTRMGRGIYTRPAAERPERPLELYEFEGCPFCRLVREALTELDLDALVHPCPKGGERFRPRVVELGGKAQFPFLVDPNTGRQLYESADIVAYLFETYGRRPLPAAWRFATLNAVSSGFATVSRGSAGSRARPSREPEEPLVLYSIESSPFARLVRERLCELEIPYLLKSTGRTKLAESVPPPLRERLHLEVTVETRNRRELEGRTGKVMVPYLIDPNTGTEMFESDAIRRHLDDTYAGR
jgi:glutathione S-transferase